MNKIQHTFSCGSMTPVTKRSETTPPIMSGTPSRSGRLPGAGRRPLTIPLKKVRVSTDVQQRRIDVAAETSLPTVAKGPPGAMFKVIGKVRVWRWGKDAAGAQPVAVRGDAGASGVNAGPLIAQVVDRKVDSEAVQHGQWERLLGGPKAREAVARYKFIEGDRKSQNNDLAALCASKGLLRELEALRMAEVFLTPGSQPNTRNADCLREHMPGDIKHIANKALASLEGDKWNFAKVVAKIRDELAIRVSVQLDEMARRMGYHESDD